ncbi:hypothetical protein MMC25_001303 [Agyrium rufum]|nr:hypothetical protein [Agyrium rufum]
MGAPRRKDIVASRRRTEDEGEEEDSLAAPIEDDSLSEGSAISDMDEDADGEDSEVSEVEAARRKAARTVPVNPTAKKSLNGKIAMPTIAPAKGKPPIAIALQDTQDMMNGMTIHDEAEEIRFEDMGKDVGDLVVPVNASAPVQDQSGRNESILDRRRREHEEYKKKREEDPAFVPNRGGFFMHDQRSAGMGQNGFRPAMRGRGRGRGGAGMMHPLAPQNAQTSGPADDLWKHDLHETVTEVPETASALPAKTFTGPALQLKTAQANIRNPPPNRSFSRSTHVGNVQVRVYISGMKDPIVFSAVPVKQHTRLPHHRPPLRRDKPVRVSITDCPIRYVFPHMDRSFVFIPRALRPNQQGFGRGGRGRGSFSTYGGFGSRRTSAYGGSNYTPSLAMSRRSSIARVASREGFISPAGSMMSRPQGAGYDAGKPVVRLPPMAQDIAMSQQATPRHPNFAPVVSLPPLTSYPPPQDPISHEHRPSTLPMHQPRPQKNVSVADIESPAFQPPQQQLQMPFHQQIPQHGQAQPGQYGPSDPNIYYQQQPPQHPQQLQPQHSHDVSLHPSQPSGTPLSQIPERAIHAQPFQPYPYHQGPPPPAFLPQQYPPPMFYYAPPPQSGAGLPPPFIPGQQYPYMAGPMAPHQPLPQDQQQMPMHMHPQPPSQQQEQHLQQPGSEEQQQQDSDAQATTPSGGMYAHESNGMVFYYDSAQMPPQGSQAPQQQQQPPPPPQVPMQPIPGMEAQGYMPAYVTGPGAPMVNGYYYPTAGYYPQ